MNSLTLTAFLADSAETIQGKIYALGIGWSAIYAERFPCTHPRLAIGIIINVPWTSTNQNHKLCVYLQDEDNSRQPLQRAITPEGEEKLLTEVSADIQLGRPPLLPPGDPQNLPFSLIFDQLTFQKPGMYSWIFEIDGTELNRISMRIAQINAPQRMQIS